jgi:hypothetical protein
LQVKVNQLELNTRNDEKIALSNPMIRTLSLSVEQTNDIESKTCGEVEGIENRITEFSIRSQKKQPSAIPPTTVDAIGSPQLNTTTVVVCQIMCFNCSENKCNLLESKED